jgi:hypothetical protein
MDEKANPKDFTAPSPYSHSFLPRGWTLKLFCNRVAGGKKCVEARIRMRGQSRNLGIIHLLVSSIKRLALSNGMVF